MTDTSPAPQLPEFDDPPVVEVALGVQFRPLFSLRPIELSKLREAWRTDYPKVNELPPLPPTVEAPTRGVPNVQFMVGPAMPTRLWFVNDDQSELVQVQHDRLHVNWRQTGAMPKYPRYPRVRHLFEQRFTDLASFTEGADIGTLAITQAEVSYINAIDATDEQLGQLDRVLGNWHAPSTHLGVPEQTRVVLVFLVPGVGEPPVRMFVTIDPSKRPDGRTALLLTLTVRGAPTGAALKNALEFMDQAHIHIVQSFAELTPEAMHTLWRRR